MTSLPRFFLSHPRSPYLRLTSKVRRLLISSLPLGALIASTVFALAIGIGRSRNASSSGLKEGQQAPIAATPHPQKLVAELVTIRPTGFDPLRVSRPKGPFLLAVENRSGLEEISLQLSRETGSKEKLHEVKVNRKVLDWRGVVDLPPGSYILTETKQGWTFRLTVNAT